MKIDGLQDVRRKLKSLEAKAGKSVIRAGVKAGLKPMLDAAKAEAPKDTGTLIKALGVKQKAYKGGLIHVGMVGARAGQKRSFTESFTKTGKLKIKLKKTTATGSRVRDASRYLDLAESGREAVRGKNGNKMRMRLASGVVIASKTAKAFAGHHFMRKAWEKVHKAAATQAIAAMKAAMQTELKSA